QPSTNGRPPTVLRSCRPPRVLRDPGLADLTLGHLLERLPGRVEARRLLGRQGWRARRDAGARDHAVEDERPLQAGERGALARGERRAVAEGVDDARDAIHPLDVARTADLPGPGPLPRHRV